MAAHAFEGDFCKHCNRRVHGVRPKWPIRVGFGAMVAATLFVVGAAGSLGYGLVLALPIVGGLGISLGPLAAAAFAAPLCPDCGRMVTAVGHSVA